MTCTDHIVVREFRKSDTPQILELMRGLAQFEGYSDEFRVTEDDILEKGFGENAIFHAFVGHLSSSSQLQAMVVTYVIPWTYDLRPTLVVKELFVSQQGRGKGLGRSLMEQVVMRAHSIGAARIQWTVLDGNYKAEEFYKHIGGEREKIWHTWKLIL